VESCIYLFIAYETEVLRRAVVVAEWVCPGKSKQLSHS